MGFLLQDVMGKTFAWAPEVKQRCSLASLLSPHGGLQPLRSSWVSEPHRSPVCRWDWGTTPGFEDLLPLMGGLEQTTSAAVSAAQKPSRRGSSPLLCVCSVSCTSGLGAGFFRTPQIKGDPKRKHQAREHLHLQDGAEPQSCVKGSAVKWVPR